MTPADFRRIERVFNLQATLLLCLSMAYAAFSIFELWTGVALEKAITHEFCAGLYGVTAYLLARAARRVGAWVK